MKVNAAVLDHDEEFRKRLSEVFQQKYHDKVRLSLFSDEEILYGNVEELQPDIILFDESSRIDQKRIPEKSVCGYFCGKQEIREIQGYPAICKYQKAENIYKGMIGLYAENSVAILPETEKTGGRIVMFTSVQGGSGTSAAAAAYALRCAVDQKRVLYLNLEKFGNSDFYFSSEGILSFSDVVYFLKSRKGSLQLKLESAVQRDRSGVEFFHTCRNAYDMLELRDEEIWDLLDGVIQMGRYDVIVIDLSGDMNDRMTEIMRIHADRIVYVTDGSAAGNDKFRRFCEAVKVVEDREGYRILDKMVLIYNRFSSKGSEQLEESPVPVLGGIHRYEGASGRDLTDRIAAIDFIGEI